MKNTQALQWIQPKPSTMFANYGKHGAGFTAIEMVVTLAVITFMAAQILVSFGGLGQGVALNRAGQQVVRILREAQNRSIAVAHARVPVSGLPTFLIPPAVGVRIDKATQQEILFAERNDDAVFLIGGSPDGKYTNADEKITIEQLPSGVRINRIIDQNTIDAYTAIHVFFTSPEAELTITKNDGSPFPGNRASIELINGAGNIKTVNVHITGQISVK